jgi:hypothetical protein
VVGFRNMAKEFRLLQGSEVLAKYAGLAQNPVKVEGIEYIQRPSEEGEEGIPRREAVCVYKAENLTYINAQPTLLSSQFSLKTGASPYTILRSSSTPCAALLAVLDKVIAQLSLGAQVTIVIDQLEILSMLDSKAEVIKFLRTIA